MILEIRGKIKMISKKKIKNDNEYNYEFELSFTDNINDIESNNNTYILVEKESLIDDAFNAINNVNLYPGLITVSIKDLYDIFSIPGIWKYKYYEEKDIKTVISKLDSIKSNNIFLSFCCDSSHTLFDYESIISSCIKNQVNNSCVRFGLPCIDDENNNIKVHVFYQ